MCWVFIIIHHYSPWLLIDVEFEVLIIPDAGPPNFLYHSIPLSTMYKDTDWTAPTPPSNRNFAESETKATPETE